jgi:hypothetical protein
VAFAGATITSNGTGSVTITGSAAAINGALNGLAYNPTADYNGPATLTVATSDGSAATVVSTVALTVTPVADITADAITTNEDTAVTISVLANDSFENAGRTITAVNGTAITAGGSAVAVANGTVSLNALGQLVFTPTANYNGPASFSYTVTSGGVTETATASVTVTAVNDAPAATGAAITGTEDTPLVLTWAGFGVSDIDSAAASLGVRITTLPADGVLQVSTNGTTWTNVTAGQLVSKATIDANFLRFVPDAHESGADSHGGSSVGNRQADYARFTFAPNDGSTDGGTATMRIDITPVADAATLSQNAATPPTGTITPPASIGLSRDYYDNITTLTSGASSTNPDTAETGIEAAVATSSGLVTNVGVAGNLANDTGVQVADDDAYRVQGLVYMEAGNTYVFSGYADDTVRLEIGGTTLLSGQWGGGGQATAGTFTSSSFTPTVNGYYSLEFMMYNTSGPGSYDLNVSINGATAVDVSTANLYLYQSITQVDAAGSQRGAFVANGSTGEGGYYPVAYNTGTQGTIRLAPLTVALTDTDGSETLAVQMQNLTAGSVLSDGTNTFTAAAGSTTATLTGWNLSQLTLTAPGGYTGTMNLLAVATTTETATGATATSSLAIPVTVTGTATSPSEIATFNADALLGQAGADTYSVSQVGAGLAVTVTQGASGSILAMTGTETTGTIHQAFSTGGGNDLVQSGAGDDTMYLGDSGSNNFPGTTTAATQAQVAATRIMTRDDGTQLVSSTTGLLVGEADDTNANNNTVGNTSITTWADVANAGSGDDAVYGQNGTDFLYGGTGNDRLYGGAGIDGLRGGAGDDTLAGGAGNDVLRGDAGSDVFRWELGDQGTTAAPASDIVMDFDVAAAGLGGDVLDLRDLLQGDAASGGAPGNLANFLHFTYAGSDTTVHISTTGAFSSGFSAGAVDQSITLQGVNLTAGGLSTDQLIIQDLLDKSKLLVDGT